MWGRRVKGRRFSDFVVVYVLRIRVMVMKPMACSPSKRRHPGSSLLNLAKKGVGRGDKRHHVGAEHGWVKNTSRLNG